LDPEEGRRAVAGFDVEKEWVYQTFKKFSESPVFGGVANHLKQANHIT
jgi:hypothetical protein